MFQRPASIRIHLLTLILACFTAVGCSSTSGWKAPEKRAIIQAQLQAIGRSEELDIPDIMEKVEKAFPAKGMPDLVKVRDALKATMPDDISLGFDALWKGIERKIGDLGTDENAAKQRIRSVIIEQLETADEDNRLYWRAKGHVRRGQDLDRRKATGVGGSFDPKANRDSLISKYILRIQDYHEANYEDVFKTTALAGFELDTLTVICAALATAFTPASTKTAFAAGATIFGGIRLAASKNILNEKTSASVLNGMITQRTQALTTLTTGMKAPISEYTVDAALVDLATYFNVGGVDKALAQLEQDTAKAKDIADKNLQEAQKKPSVEGRFATTGTADATKLKAELHFDNKDLPGTIDVKEVQVNGKTLPADAFSVEGGDDKPTVVKFAQSAGLSTGQQVTILGDASKTGLHIGTITWLQ